jgi:formylglycine-generating enzyme required for sulfatase activity
MKGATAAARAGGGGGPVTVGRRVALVPAGTFVMGSPEGRPHSSRDEIPAHAVTITRPFFLGVYAVTQEEFVRVMGFNPSSRAVPGGPAESVDFAMAMRFVESLNRLEGTGRYRLPTEAEWERAARGGTSTDYFFGDDPEAIGRYAWHKGNSGGGASPVGRLAPNPYGLYDVIGNVFEWTADPYDEFYYEASPILDPSGPIGDFDVRSVRGCAWDMDFHHCRSADRGNLSGRERLPNQGLRIAYTAEQAG